MAKPWGSPKKKGEEGSFVEEREKLGVNKKPVGINWEFKVLWVLVGRVVADSPWLGCCPGRREPSFPPTGVVM